MAIVTGGGHGIGAAYCAGLAREGAAVVAADIDGAAAERVAAGLRAAGREALGVQTDVADEASTQALARATLDGFGRIDVLLNNAAIFQSVPMSRVGILEVSPEEWDRLMAVNLRGTFLCCRAVLPDMLSRQSGSIINISSSTVLFGSPTRIHYVASKAGIIGFTRSLAREVGPANIRVNAIAPGSTLSDDNPTPESIAYRQQRLGARALQRVQYPDDLVGTALFLASDDSAFVTGQTIAVDGGDVMI